MNAYREQLPAPYPLVPIIWGSWCTFFTCFWKCRELVLNFITFSCQVFHRLWHVPFLHSSHWIWLERRNRAIQVHWELPCISRQTETTMANLPCTQGTGLFFCGLLCGRRIIRGTDGKGGPWETLAEVQGWHCRLWPCAQLWKIMPGLRGIIEWTKLCYSL